MMAAGHRAVAVPCGLGLAWVSAAHVPAMVSAVCAVLVVLLSTVPDWDQPYWKKRLHPGPALLRLVVVMCGGRLTHRGITHTFEWCAVMGVLAALVAQRVPPMAPWSSWFGAAVAVSLSCHLVADMCTYDGIPGSLLWNTVVHREPWRRHSFGLFGTNSSGEQYLAIPVALVAGLCVAAAWSGAWRPLATFLVGF